MNLPRTVDAYVTLCFPVVVAQPQQLLTTGQVAALLGLHIRKVQRLAESGELPVAQKLPGPYGRYVFDATQVELWRYRQSERTAS
jgi:excisionase family DNA binding protein